MTQTDAYRLISACFASRTDAEAVLVKEPELLAARTGLGETPLHFLAVENQLEAVQLLVEHGADVNTVNDCGGTPLSEAASLGYADLVAYLLSRGARLKLPGQHEPTLHEAVRSGDSSIVAMILAAGADVAETNDLDETALHVAAETDDRLDTLRVLLDHGANESATRIFSETVMDVAQRSSSTKIVEELVTRRAQLR